MARTFLTIVLFLAFSSMGAPQMKAPADVGIDEKLGKQVALDVVLKDENANDMTLRQLVDKPTILMFNYYRCPGICPVLLNSMVEVVNQIQLEPGKDFRLIAVSFDPADTPEQARQKKANYLNMLKRQFSPDAWHFLTGSAENTKSSGRLCGIQLSQTGGHVCSSRGDHSAHAEGDHQPVFIRHHFPHCGCGNGNSGGSRRQGTPDNFEGSVFLLHLRSRKDGHMFSA